MVDNQKAPQPNNADMANNEPAQTDDGYARITEANLNGLKAEAKKNKQMARQRKDQLDNLQGQMNDLLADFDCEDIGQLAAKLTSGKEQTTQNDLQLKQLNRKLEKTQKLLDGYIKKDRDHAVTEMINTTLRKANVLPDRADFVESALRAKATHDGDGAGYLNGESVDDMAEWVKKTVPECVRTPGVKSGVGGITAPNGSPVKGLGSERDLSDPFALIRKGLEAQQQ